MSKKQIGWYYLKEETDFYNDFETAAWYEQVRVQPGKYPVVAYDVTFGEDGRMYSHCSSAYVNMVGVIVRDNFQSLFCGVPIGSVYDSEKNKGKETNTHMRPYLYMIAESILDGESNYELLPEFEARRETHYSEYLKEELTTNGIYRKEV